MAKGERRKAGRRRGFWMERWEGGKALRMRRLATDGHRQSEKGLSRGWVRNERGSEQKKGFESGKQEGGRKGERLKVERLKAGEEGFNLGGGKAGKRNLSS